MKRLLAILLVAAMLLTVLVACSEDKPAGDTTSANTDETTQQPVVLEPDENDLIIAKNNVSDYIIMISCDTEVGGVEHEVAIALRDEIFAISGVRLRIATATKKNQQDHEILIGKTERERSLIEVDRSTLGEDGYHVYTEGQRVIFAANSDAGYWKAARAFAIECMGYDPYTSLSSPAKRDVFFVRDDIQIYSGIDASKPTSINGVDLKDYAVVCGDGFNAAAKYLYTAIRKLTGSAPEMIYDSNKKSADNEIIVGPSAREGTYYNFDYSTLKDGECKVIAAGTRLAFLTQNPDDALYAVREFLSEHFGYLEDFEMPSESVTYVQANDQVLTYSSGSKDGVTFEYTAVGDCKYNDLIAQRTNALLGEFDTEIVCYSQTAQRFAELVLNEARLRSMKEDDVRISLTYNSPAPICTCNACQKAAEEEGTPLGAYFRMVKLAAETIRDEYPDALITIAAFGKTAQLPKLDLPDNVAVYYLIWNCCASHAINDPDCDINKEVNAGLKAWIEKCGRVYVLDMTSDYYYYPTFFPNFFTVLKNVNYYAQCGVRGVLLQYDTLLSSLEFGELRGYLYEELLKDPTMTEEEYRQLMLRYIGKIYSKDSQQPMYDFIDLMCRNKSTDCFTPFDNADITLPIPRSTDSKGNTTYDLTVAIQAYKLWEKIHPYYEGLALNDSYLNQMLFNQYQREPEGFSFVSFAQWLSANIDYTDKAVVLNQLYDALGIAHD